jgi:glutathione synthase
MREAQDRGGSVATCQIDSLGIDGSGSAYAHALDIELRAGIDWFVPGDQERTRLDDFDVVWMRKDPPVDLRFLYATHILSMARQALVVNEPSALREANEKLFALRFADYCPRTLVSASLDELSAFLEELGQMVVKPLGGAGGEGVFHITPGDRNARAILELSTHHGRELTMAQAYVPEVRQGDKRIILVEGEPVGAVLRVPRESEARANFHAGGRAVQSEITEREREICAAMSKTLRDMGLLFVGIDVIGGFLTEINVTSPTGIREIYELDGVALEKNVLDAVERRRAAVAAS